MDGLIGLIGTLGLLFLAGGALGFIDRRHFTPRWLVVAALLVVVNDALLTRFYGVMPDLLPESDWNWQGKILALLATLAIAALPAFGWRRSGLTFAQAAGSLKAAIPVALLYCAIFVGLAVAFPDGKPSGDEIAFQLTMPGFEEEPFYRGILLLALDRAFTGRVYFLGVDWGWGGVLSCGLFGLTHAFGFSHNAFSFDPIIMGLTALPSFVALWLRLRTNSLLLPVILHNFGNSFSLFA